MIKYNPNKRLSLKDYKTVLDEIEILDLDNSRFNAFYDEITEEEIERARVILKMKEALIDLIGDAELILSVKEIDGYKLNDRDRELYEEALRLKAEK